MSTYTSIIQNISVPNPDAQLTKHSKLTSYAYLPRSHKLKVFLAERLANKLPSKYVGEVPKHAVYNQRKSLGKPPYRMPRGDLVSVRGVAWQTLIAKLVGEAQHSSSTFSVVNAAAIEKASCVEQPCWLLQKTTPSGRGSAAVMKLKAKTDDKGKSYEAPYLDLLGVLCHCDWTSVRWKDTRERSHLCGKGFLKGLPKGGLYCVNPYHISLESSLVNCDRRNCHSAWNNVDKAAENVVELAKAAGSNCSHTPPCRYHSSSGELVCLCTNTSQASLPSREKVLIEEAYWSE